MKTLKLVMLIASLLVGMSACGVPAEGDASTPAAESAAAPFTTRSIEFGPSARAVKLDSGEWQVTGEDGESSYECDYCERVSLRCWGGRFPDRTPDR